MALAGCDLSDDSPNEGRIRTDCFTQSPQARPTRAEVESFASVRLPADTGGLRTSCQGFMDIYLEARLTMPAGELDRFLRRSGFRARRPGERRRLSRKDRPGTAYRRLTVRIPGERALVRLVAFTT